MKMSELILFLGLIAVAAADRLPDCFAQEGDTPLLIKRDVYLLAGLIEGEAGNQPLDCKVGVGAVVLNRLDALSFPNTLPGVIYQPGAFGSVSRGGLSVQPSSESIQAARLAFSGIDPSDGSLKYWDPRATLKSRGWRPIVVQILGRYFFGY
jgi:N-acetylmuramoyl-L-alanine amidase